MAVRGRGIPHSRRFLANLDFYAKVPTDLLEGSKQGSFVSVFALLSIATLFYRETQDFLTPKLVSDLHLDRPSYDVRKQKRSRNVGGIWGLFQEDIKEDDMADKLEVRFNITMMDLKCDYATINAVSVLGFEQNITKEVSRWNLDANGVKLQYAIRNPNQIDVQHYDSNVEETLEKLHENGEDVINLNMETFYYALQDYEFVFVDFYTSECAPCLQMAPTWEKFAEIMHDAGNDIKPKQDLYNMTEYEAAKKLQLPVLIAKVNCTAEPELCSRASMKEYPTLILYTLGKQEIGGKYRGDRTIPGFLKALTEIEDFLNKNEEGREQIKDHIDFALSRHPDLNKQHKDWLTTLERSGHRHYKVWDDAEHPGCMMAGTLYMNRVPGRFYIQADSSKSGYFLDPRLANLSHEVHHLSFRSASREVEGMDEIVPDDFEKAVHPMDGHAYITGEYHQAHSHYLKLVSTSVQDYQVLQNSQISYYDDDKIPEAKFILDISPIAVRYRLAWRPWYDYVTSLVAIIGGLFTVVGLLNAFASEGLNQIRHLSKCFKSSNTKQKPAATDGYH